MFSIQSYWTRCEELPNKCNSVNIAENSEHSESQGFESEDVALSSSTNDRTSEWFIDSAATKHMIYNRSILMDFTQYKDPLKIYLGDSTVVSALAIDILIIVTVYK